MPRASWAEDTRLPPPRGAMEPGKVGVPRGSARAGAFLPWLELRRELEAEFGSGDS